MTTIIPLSNFTFLNYATPTPLLPTSLPFTLSTEPVTDLWRKPPNLIASNQPTLYTPLHLSTFVSATASFRADWKTLYDQAGLILLFPHSSSSAGIAGRPPAGVDQVRRRIRQRYPESRNGFCAVQFVGGLVTRAEF